MSTWLVPRSELTPDQLRAIGLPHRTHQIIIGAPGSGKTLILLYRAAALRERLGTPPERFIILVYTNVLKEYIRSALNLLNLPADAVTTYDDWCMNIYKKYCSRSIPWNHENNQPDFAALRSRVADLAERGILPFPAYDFVLVDEAQDLDSLCFETLKRAAKHLTVCMDYRQQIYEHGSRESEIKSILGTTTRNITLLDAYRCSPYVAYVAAQFLDDPKDRERYIAQTRTIQAERETPLLFYAETWQEDNDHLCEILGKRLLVDQHVAILVPTRRELYRISKILSNAELPFEKQPDINFNTSAPKLITFHSAKGLTFDSVLLPRLEVDTFPRQWEKRIPQLMFVAITRATRWVYLSASESRALPLLQVLSPLAQKKVLTIQKGKQVVTGRPANINVKSPLDFL